MEDNVMNLEEVENDPIDIPEGAGYISDATRAYLNSIRAIPLLTFEEEQALGARMATGDKSAREKFINSNLRLVVSIAKTYLHRSRMPFLDLIQEGNMGLITAVNKFDYTKRLKFSTYATYWIKQAIGKYVTENSHSMRIPMHVIEQLSKISKATNALAIELERDPTDAEIAARVEMTMEKVKELRSLKKDTVSIDQTINDEDDATLGDLIADKDNEAPEVALMQNEVTQKIEEVFSSLESREADILRRRYGLTTGRPQTLEEVGKVYGLSKERIRQIEEKALKKLRNPMRANILKECMED